MLGFEICFYWKGDRQVDKVDFCVYTEEAINIQESYLKDKY